VQRRQGTRFRLRAGWWIVVAVIAALVAAPHEALAQAAPPPGFVYLRDVDSSIAQDIRYAGFDNFVGRPLPGYEAPECVVRREVAAALKRVQASLAASGLSLKVYDCYRPARAVSAMAAWAHDGRSGGATKRFFPKLQKGSLFALGYISSRSQHSTGIAVDLTLIQAAAAAAAAFDPRAAYGPCTGAAGERGPDNSIDMGTGYDCFDVKSHTASAVSPEQRRSRNTLLAAMAAAGFRNYPREWWHFSYGPARAGAQDFPIRAHAATRERADHAQESK
jgi:zinc D-Ala-D-Ala dipeptidase